MLDEKEIIRIFSDKLDIKNLDDVTVLEKGIVIKSDMLVASTDVPCGMKAWQIARKSIVSCISDFAAKGVRPHSAMISLGIPNDCSIQRTDIEGLAKGFAIASKEFEVKIVGGDTNEACELVINCSIIGFTRFPVPTRKGMKPGEYVVVSGRFGFTAAGLAILLKKAIITNSSNNVFRKHALKSVLEPNPSLNFGLCLARYFSSSIDSSDGLALSLYELATQSRLDVDIRIDSIPIAEGLEKFAKDNGVDPYDLVFYGGEEYQIVATISSTKIKQAKKAAKQAGVDLHIIGRVHRGSRKVFARNKQLKNRGYMHFHKR